MTKTLSPTWPGGARPKQERTIISIGAKPPKFSGRGIYVDGKTAVAQDVGLSFDDEKRALIVTPPGRPPEAWAYDDLRNLPDQAGGDGMLLGRAGGDPARVEVLATDADMIRTRADRLGRRVAVVHRGKLAGLAFAAVASVALMIFVLVPFLASRLADFLPPEGEAALGAATLGQIRGALSETGLGVAICEEPDGQAALGAMVEVLTQNAENLETPLTVHVLDHPMVNAFALPGGHIVLFRGLIEAAETAEEVAAVTAHEIGHVVARDPTRIALQSAGSIGVLGLLFGDFAGGAIVLLLAERMIQAEYTQDAETAADAYGAAVLEASNVSPAALATFFERLQKEGGELPAIVQHFLSHPALEDRIFSARTLSEGVGNTRPILTPVQWQSLRVICGDGPRS